jgi:uncharacterized protein DUF397
MVSQGDEMIDSEYAGRSDFRSSSFCSSGGCVEVALLPDGRVAVRDGKDPQRSAHFYSVGEWRDFVAGVKKGEFDF